VPLEIGHFFDVILVDRRAGPLLRLGDVDGEGPVKSGHVQHEREGLA
jgi:hypothetical protein